MKIQSSHLSFLSTSLRNLNQILLVSLFTILGNSLFGQQNISYTSFYSKSAFNNVALSTSLPVGTTGGSGSVSNGAASYTIPLMKLPSTGKEAVPPINISITYNSMSGNGVLGMGWSISGAMSVISRVSKNIVHNGGTSPSCTSEDEFALDGKRLIRKSVSSPSPSIEYWTASDIDDYSEIESHKDNMGRIYKFLITKKDGSIYKYGIDSRSRILAQNSGSHNTVCNTSNGGYILFYLDEIEFLNGNHRWYDYTSFGIHEKTIERISDMYGEYEFNYKIRSDINETYINGVKNKHDLLLDNVKVTNFEGNLMRKYYFVYSTDNINSYLTQIEEENINGNIINPIIFRYDEKTTNANFVTQSPKFALPTPPSQGITNSKYFSGDFNADGYTDIVAINSQVNTSVNIGYTSGFQVYINNKDNTYKKIYTANALTDEIFFKNDDVFQTVLASDYNGDGYDDIIVNKVSHGVSATGTNKYYYHSTTIYYSANNGTTFNKVVTPFGSSAKLFYDPDYFFLTGDFDGDGSSDYIFRESQSTNFTTDKFYISFPSKNKYNYLLSGPISQTLDVDDWRSLDMDGDGKSEVLVVNGNNSKIYSFDIKHNFSNYSTNQVYSGGYPTKWHKLFLGDFNGDKKTDILTPATQGRLSQSFHIGYSTGNKFDEKLNAVTFSTQAELEELSGLGNLCNKDLIAISDYNGDGRSDILHIHEDNAGKDDIDVYYSKGKSFHTKSFSPPSNATKADLHCSKYAVVGDFNADGKSDINAGWFGSVIINGVHHSWPRRHVYFDENKKDLLVNEIKNGYGNTVEFTYESLPQYSHYQRKYNGSDNMTTMTQSYERNLYLSLPINVVSIFNEPKNYNTKAYIYKGGVVNMDGGGFLGFRELQVLDFYNSTLTKTYTNNHTEFSRVLYPHLLMPDLVEVEKLLSNNNTQLISSVKKYYNTISRHSNNITGPITNSGNSGLKLINYLTEVDEYFKGVSTVENSYDQYGNITSTKSTSPSGHIKVTDFDFGTNASSKPPLLETSKLTYSRTGKPNISNTTKYEYTNKGQVEKKTEYFGLPNTITTEYEYNVLGLTSKTTVTGKNMTPRVSEIIYDATWNIKPIKYKNSLGQESTVEYHSTWMKPKKSTGISGLTTNFEYDDWGRKIKTTSPSGVVSNTNYAWDNSISIPWANKSLFKITQTATNSPTNISYHDLTGKLVASKSQNFDGTYNTVKKFYNTKNVNYKSLEYNSNNLLIKGSEVKFDIYDRPTENLFIDKNGTSHTLSSTTYTKGVDYWETSTTKYANSGTHLFSNDPYTYDVTSSQKTSLEGEQLETSKNSTNTITYTYNADGKIHKVMNGNTVLAETFYDVYGRQSKLIDNSAGTTYYYYDALGQITRQNNPSGFVRYQYDILGRKTKEILDEGTINYTYFPSGSGVKTNLLKEVKGYNFGNKEEYDYDNFGRLDKVTKYISGSPVTSGYITQTEYDNNGNLTKKTSPSGNVYDYTYNQYGYLTEIKKGNQSIYSLTKVNALGGADEYFLGGFAKVENKYDDFGMIKEISSNYIKDEYVWDNLSGNVIEKKEFNKFSLNPALIHHLYEYDNFDRLKNDIRVDNSMTPRTSEYFSYLDDGRVTFKMHTNTTPYVYNSGKRFAIKKIDYDANNFSPYPQEISYSSFNKPTLLKQNGYELRFKYNSSYDRVSAILKHNNQVQNKRIYCGDVDFNYNGSNSLLYSIDYIYAGDQLVAMDIKDPRSTTTGGGGGGGSAMAAPGSVARLNNSGLWYVHEDYQGTVRTVFDKYGVVYYQNFDAWGNYVENRTSFANFRKRVFEKPNTIPEWIYRGYTGQEHIPEFRLINLNARLYDPHISRMLSPDNYVTANSLEGFNRYSYAHNNPTKYVDPDGNLPIVAGVIIGTVVGAYFGGASANGTFDPFKWNYGATWHNIAMGGVIGGTTSLMTAGIGMSFGDVGSAGYTVMADGYLNAPNIALGVVGNEVARAGAHGILNGMTATAGGGSFGSGFASGVFGSALGSGAMMYGGDIGNSIGGGYAVSTLAGGVGSELGGGDFLQGAAIGATIHGLNHLWDHSTGKLLSTEERWGGDELDYLSKNGKIVEWKEVTSSVTYGANWGSSYGYRTVPGSNAIESSALFGDPVSMYFGLIRAPIGGRWLAGNNNWLRMGSSFSQSGVFRTYAIKWGAGYKYWQKISNPAVQRFNGWLRSLKIPGNSWRTADPGHFHLFKKWW